MFKVIAASTVLVLLIGSGAMGSIIQDQGMAIGTVNGINLLHGQGTASSSQTLIVNITQNGDGIGSAFASAHLLGINSQIGGISAMAGLVHVGGLSAGSLLTSSNSTLRDMTDMGRLDMLMLSAN